MINKGIVLNVEDNKVTVSMYKDAACSSCAGCGNKSKTSGNFEFLTDVEVKKGDVVSFEMEDAFVLKVAALVYVIPLIAMILSYIIASKLGASEGVGALISFGSLILSFVGIYIFDKDKGKNMVNQKVKITNVTHLENQIESTCSV